MTFANATWFDSKSGVAQGRDLQFRFRAQRKCRGLRVPFLQVAKLQIPPLRCADKFWGDGPPWQEWRWMDRATATNPLSFARVLFC
jgi:hypothetical protein